MVQVMNETLELEAVSSLPNGKKDTAEDPTISPQTLVSQIERLVAISSTQQGNSLDLSSMIRSTVDRVVQDAVNKALQSQPTLASVRPPGVGVQGFEDTAMNHMGQNSVADSRISVISGLKHSLSDDVNSDVGEALERSATVSVHGSATSQSAERSDFVSQRLLSLWSDVLDLPEDSIEPNDSFFVSFTLCGLKHMLTHSENGWR